MITWRRLSNSRPLGATVRPHDYLFSTHAHQLGARGNTRRRSIYSLWTYSIDYGKLRLDTEGSRLSYTFNFHCARDPVTFARDGARGLSPV
jgi:hypothetical protein